MAGEETLGELILQWKQLLLALFVIGIGYIGLAHLEYWKGKSVTEMKSYDKFFRSALLGFVSFLIILTISQTDITNEESIVELIREKGITLFALNVLICIGISYALFLFYNSKESSDKPKKRIKRKR